MSHSSNSNQQEDTTHQSSSSQSSFSPKSIPPRLVRLIEPKKEGKKKEAAYNMETPV